MNTSTQSLNGHTDLAGSTLTPNLGGLGIGDSRLDEAVNCLSSLSFPGIFSPAPKMFSFENTPIKGTGHIYFPFLS